MRFYREIVAGLKKLLDELIIKNEKLKDESVYHLIVVQFNSNQNANDDTKDVKLKSDSKGSGKEGGNDLVKFTAFVRSLSALTDDEELRNKIFIYLDQQRFHHLKNIDHSAQRTISDQILLALLNDFFTHPEIKLEDILGWVKSYQVEALNNELMRKLVNTSKDTLATLKKLNQQGVVTEIELLNWLATNDKNNLAIYIINRPKILERHLLVKYLNVFLAEMASLTITVPAKQSLLLRMKGLDLDKDRINAWVTRNGSRELDLIFSNHFPDVYSRPKP